MIIGKLTLKEMLEYLGRIGLDVKIEFQPKRKLVYKYHIVGH